MAERSERTLCAAVSCALLGSFAFANACAPAASPPPTAPAAAVSAAPSAPPAPALANWLVEDFEQANGLSGGFWYEFDKNPLGTVAKPNPFQLEAGGSSASPGFAAHISGTLGADRAPWTWVQLQVFLSRDKKAMDLRGYKTLSFFVKGDGGRYWVSLVRNAVKNYDNFHYEFTAPPTWTEMRVPIKEFRQSGWGPTLPQQFDDVTTIQFSPAVHDKAFDVAFDHVSLSTQEVKLEPIAYDTKDWFPWTGTDPVKRRGTALDVSRLLDAPAGKHGPLTRKGDTFAFRNGKPARFWGVNIVASANFPSHAEAERLAELLAQLGVNMTRHHHIDAAWSNPNVFGNKPTTLALDDSAMERFDYFIKELQKRGIYQFFDMVVHRKLTDADGVANAKELAAGFKIEGEFVPEVIAQEERFVEQFMGHKNQYTGRSYAQDPAVALLEAINEDSLFWIQKSGEFAVKPAFRGVLNGLFSTYLKKAVPGGRAALEARWANKGGPGEGLRADEDPDKGNVDATLWMADAPERASAARREDTLRFLYETELAFYRRIEARLRKLGYQGLVTGSNHWVEHPLDLLANAQLDFVDRHSYWSHPNGGWGYNTGISWDPAAMVKDPNLGVVGSLARRRVKGLPYSTSEWQTSAPNDYRAEGALLVGAYAAFQDSSPLQFALSHDGNKRPEAAGALNNNFDIIDQPTMLGGWPAVSLLFHRADVRKSPLEACLKIDPKEAFQGAVSPVLPAGLAQVARTGVDFRGGMSVAELTALRDRHVKGTVVTSNTGELRHDASNGRFEVDTARSQAFAGFKPNAPIALGNATIEFENPFAVIIVSALDDAPIASAKRVLVSALGNAVNTGMSLAPGGNRLMNAGTAPTLVEPIRAKIALSKLAGALEKTHLYALGASGERTGEVPLLRDKGSLTFSIGPAQRALHYELVRE
ncbi:MAG TPA: CIA30 family protein [Polyangiaceae bacterium]|nr:CIA30 family protein [Polyangiaceae bacterium]